MLEHNRVGARPLHRPSYPPAAAGGQIERILTVAVVAQQSDSSLEPARVLGLRHHFHE